MRAEDSAARRTPQLHPGGEFGMADRRGSLSQLLTDAQTGNRDHCRTKPPDPRHHKHPNPDKRGLGNLDLHLRDRSEPDQPRRSTTHRASRGRCTASVRQRATERCPRTADPGPRPPRAHGARCPNAVAHSRARRCSQRSRRCDETQLAPNPLRAGTVARGRPRRDVGQGHNRTTEST
jgi:hypothetical protein